VDPAKKSPDKPTFSDCGFLTIRFLAGRQAKKSLAAHLARRVLALHD
jgi:hypothetical protein